MVYIPGVPSMYLDMNIRHWVECAKIIYNLWPWKYISFNNKTEI